MCLATQTPAPDSFVTETYQSNSCSNNTLASESLGKLGTIIKLKFQVYDLLTECRQSGGFSIKAHYNKRDPEASRTGFSH